MTLRVSIRYKILLVISLVLFGAMGTFLYLATSSFKRDKLVYIYDLNASLVETLSEQTRAELGVFERSLHLFAQEVLRPERTDADRKGAAAELFARDKNLIRVQIFERGTDGALTQRYAFKSDKLLGELGLGADDLAHIRSEWPLPLAAVAGRAGQPYVQNSSLKPNAAILTFAVAFPTSTDKAFVVAADFRPETLLRIFRRSKLHTTYLVDERGEVLVHPDAAKVVGHTQLGEHPLVKAALRAGAATSVKEFEDPDGKTMLGGYDQVNVARLAVVTQVEKSQALRASRELVRRSLLFGLAIILGAIVASIGLSRLVTSPIRRLRLAVERVGKGEFDVDIKARSRDEIGDLARAFGEMAKNLRETQDQLVQSEKLAAIGQLGAGITHEVKNPLTAIVGFAQIGQTKLPHDPEKVVELLKLIQAEGLRCRDILSNFLKFVRNEPHERDWLSVNDVVRDAVRVFAHQLKIKDVNVTTELAEDLPPIMANGGQLQQVLLNLAINAADAMTSGGALVLSTSYNGSGSVVIQVADNGPGMPEEVRQKIFDPFFTTKSAEQGTGLGLSVSFGIIRDHNGAISVRSDVGKGTVFAIELPASAATQHVQEDQA